MIRVKRMVYIYFLIISRGNTIFSTQFFGVQHTTSKPKEKEKIDHRGNDTKDFHSIVFAH
jgi:hypothetical protein